MSLLSVTASFLLPLPAILNDQWHLHKARHRSKLLQTLSAGNIQSQSLDHLWNKLRGSAFSISLWTTLYTSMGSKHATAQQGCYSGVAPRAIFTGQHVGVLDFVGVTLNSLLSCEFHHEYTRPTNVAIFLNPTRNGHSSWHGRAVVEWTMLVGWGGGGRGTMQCRGKWAGPVPDRHRF